MRRRRSDVWKDHKQRSIWHFGEDRHYEGPASTLYGHAFWEDVHNGVMPIGGQARRNSDFAIGITPDDSILEEILCEGLATRGDHIRTSLNEALSDFISEAAGSLAFAGRAIYEIVDGPPHNDEPTRSYFRLSPLPRGRITRIFNEYIQHVPIWAMSRFNRIANVIPRKNILDIRLPKKLGNVYKHKRMLQQLALASEIYPGFVKNDFEKYISNSSFDFRDYHANQRTLIYRSTKNWGWIPSMSLQSDPITEYYFAYRYLLRFQRTLALLRDHILWSVNSMLKQRGFLSKVIIKGMPTIKEIDDMFLKLDSGDMTLEQVFEVFNRI